MMLYDLSMLCMDPVSSFLDAFIELKLKVEQYFLLGYPTIFKTTLDVYEGMVASVGYILWA